MSEQNPRTFWLSFTDEDEFGGVAIIDLCQDDIGTDEVPVYAAIRKSIRLGINPGPDYSVIGQELPPNEIPIQFKSRLLRRVEVDRLNRQTHGAATGGRLPDPVWQRFDAHERTGRRRRRLI